MAENKTGIVISTKMACLIGGLLMGGVLFDAYLDRQEMKQRMEAVEAQTQETAQDIQEIKTLLIRSHKQVKYTPEDEQCLAKNIYHEAGVESEVGKVAVGQVTLNRLATGRWGNNICDVVYAKKQFSWTISSKLKSEKPKGDLWVQSQIAAKQVLHGLRVSTLSNSLFYHTDYIDTPKWVEPKAKVTQIDQHIFYTKTKFVLIPKCELKARRCKDKRPRRKANT